MVAIREIDDKWTFPLVHITFRFYGSDPFRWLRFDHLAERIRKPDRHLRAP